MVSSDQFYPIQTGMMQAQLLAEHPSLSHPLAD